MTRFIHTLALTAALVAPGLTQAETLRAQSPARALLGQVTGVIGTPALAAGRFQEPGAVLTGDWSPARIRVDEIGMVHVGGSDSAVQIDPDGGMTFTVGCNRYAAQASTRAGNRLTIEAIRGTLMACPPDEARLEHRLIDALHAVRRYEIDDTLLILQDWHGGTLLELRAVPIRVPGLFPPRAPWADPHPELDHPHGPWHRG
ncbi:MAG: META domain-containing protein [Rhodobacter sp.]|nr:META domain-containing protein [Paracoccaceae bacterium]MCC0075313.1 META domain-containing protein [Rhodobacter sp.]